MASAAHAATPRDGRFTGPTTQDTKPPAMSFTIAREGRVIRSVAFPSVARCGKRVKLRLTVPIRAAAKLVKGPRIKQRGRVAGRLGKRLRYRGVYRLDGRFPTRSRARGTWGLRAVVVDRRGRVRYRCRTGTVSWFADRL